MSSEYRKFCLKGVESEQSSSLSISTSEVFQSGEWNGVGSIPVRAKSPSISGWIEWPLVIQHKDRNMAKSWDLTET